MLHRTHPLAAVAALLSLAAIPLAGCENKPEIVDTRAADPLAAQVNAAAPVVLPPSIKANVTFRCQPGNTLAYVDFFQGDTQANLRTEQGGTPTMLKADAPGNPFVGGGYTVTGNEKQIDLTGPDGTKSCKA